MTKIERFEDLQSWQKARQLANSIYLINFFFFLSFSRGFWG